MTRNAPPPGRKGVDDRGRIVTAAEVEQNIARISDELEALTDRLVMLAEQASVAEVDWKKARARIRTQTRAMGGDGPGGRATEAECEDAAIDKGADLLLAYRLATSTYEATRDAMFTKRTQIEALRTIAANIRAQT